MLISFLDNGDNRERSTSSFSNSSKRNVRVALSKCEHWGVAVNTCYASWRPLETDKTAGWRVGRCEGVSYFDVFEPRPPQLKLRRCADNALEVPSLFAFYSNQIVHWEQASQNYGCIWSLNCPPLDKPVCCVKRIWHL